MAFGIRAIIRKKIILKNNNDLILVELTIEISDSESYSVQEREYLHKTIFPCNYRVSVLIL